MSRTRDSRSDSRLSCGVVRVRVWLAEARVIRGGRGALKVTNSLHRLRLLGGPWLERGREREGDNCPVISSLLARHVASASPETMTIVVHRLKTPGSLVNGSLF